MFRKIVIACLLSLALFGCRTTHFSDIYVFGDGLSDQGRFGELTANRYPPSPPFHEGRWTNGPVWIETLASRMGIALNPDHNYATGGATTGYENINAPLREALELDQEDPILGLQAQIDTAINNTPELDPDALYIVWAGGHDYNEYLEFGQPDVTQHPPADNIREGLIKLIDHGARKIMVGNLPDMGQTPLYYGTEKQATATELTQAYNRSLATMVRKIEKKYPVEVMLLDADRLFRQIAARPERYGFQYFDSYLPLDYIDFSNPLGPSPYETIPNAEAGLNVDQFTTFWGLAATTRVHDLIAARAFKGIQRYFRAHSVP